MVSCFEPPPFGVVEDDGSDETVLLELAYVAIKDSEGFDFAVLWSAEGCVKMTVSVADVPRRFFSEFAGDGLYDGIVKNDFHTCYITINIG